MVDLARAMQAAASMVFCAVNLPARDAGDFLRPESFG